MQVKRFFAADMRTAMKLVRDELGADASIIGNRRVAGGVELTAALDYQVPAAPSRAPNPALEAELRKTQSRIANAQAELTTRAQSHAHKDRQLFGGDLELPAAPLAAALRAPKSTVGVAEQGALDGGTEHGLGNRIHRDSSQLGQMPKLTEPGRIGRG